MTSVILYIAHTNSTLKRFTGHTEKQIVLLDQLHRIGKPCTYSHLYNVLGDMNCTLNHRVYNAILRRCIDKGYITRTQVGRNVLFAITLSGKQLLYSFSIELDKIVKADIAKHGNGLPS